MNSYEFELDQLMINNISKPIRTKLDIIIILLYTLQYILWKPIEKNITARLKIVINKMKRVFYYLDTKMFSIVLPFSIKKVKAQIDIYDNLNDNLVIDNKIIAILISIFESALNNDYRFFEILDEHCLENNITNCEKEYLSQIIYKLLFTEYGYVRYDDDIKREKSKIHPRFHFDLNATPNATFKIGIDKAISLDQFIDILDITTECKYIK